MEYRNIKAKNNPFLSLYDTVVYCVACKSIFCDPELLPSHIIETIDDKKREINIARNAEFIDRAFKHLAVNEDLYRHAFRFSYENTRNCDGNIIYLMYKLRNSPNVLIESGYTTYLFNLKIIDGNTANDDSKYTLTITENSTGKTGVYETMVGRFD